MLFHSIDFLFFFTIVIIVYYLLSNKYRWILLLIASYYFYMCWKPEYAVLILGSTIVDYFVTIKIAETSNKKKKKRLLYISLIFNLTLLFFFKYFNFFNDTFYNIFQSYNIFYDKPIFDVLLPVGISFYTFQTLSYTIDVYRGNTLPERHFGKFAVFVSFFPQLVAGPIERSNRLIPMLKKDKQFSYENFSEGFKIMLWGYFMKLVVADRLSLYVDAVYNNLNDHSSLTIIIASSFFLFQIYCDFAGYSYVAIGAAKILGVDLMENFRRPNFASSIGDLWKRWHISLSTWFRDYVYIPLGGNRVSTNRFYLNLFLTFLISGLWHGANWTFVLWGAYHGLFMVIEVFIKKNVKINFLKKYNFRILGIIIVFLIKVVSYFFFRANSVSDSFFIFKRVFYEWKSGFYFGNTNVFMLSLIGILILTTIEIKHEFYSGKFLIFHNKNYYIRIISMAIFIAMIIYLGVFDGGQFIYFQF